MHGGPRRTTIISVAFILTSAILFSARYMFIAILCTTQNTSAANFQDMLEEHGGPLLNLSIISLIIGISYLLADIFKKEKSTS